MFVIKLNASIQLKNRTSILMQNTILLVHNAVFSGLIISKLSI